MVRLIIYAPISDLTIIGAEQAEWGTEPFRVTLTSFGLFAVVSFEVMRLFEVMLLSC